MEITPNKQLKSIWLIVFGTAAVTAVIVIAVLYSLGLLNHSSAQSMMGHTEGMVHEEGMDHEVHMNGRQAEVAALGREVMPFDLDRTTHVFDKQDFGGIQQVITDDGDAEQIALIQAHLAEEAERFQEGDFSDPAHIHGADMPGLAELQANFAQIEVVYVALPDGGQITYTSEAPALITAIHDWFDAQLTDHGSHAIDRP